MDDIMKYKPIVVSLHPKPRTSARPRVRLRPPVKGVAAPRRSASVGSRDATKPPLIANARRVVTDEMLSTLQRLPRFRSAAAALSSSAAALPPRCIRINPAAPPLSSPPRGIRGSAGMRKGHARLQMTGRIPKTRKGMRNCHASSRPPMWLRRPPRGGPVMQPMPVTIPIVAITRPTIPTFTMRVFSVMSISAPFSARLPMRPFRK